MLDVGCWLLNVECWMCENEKLLLSCQATTVTSHLSSGAWRARAVGLCATAKAKKRADEKRGKIGPRPAFSLFSSTASHYEYARDPSWIAWASPTMARKEPHSWHRIIHIHPLEPLKLGPRGPRLLFSYLILFFYPSYFLLIPFLFLSWTILHRCCRTISFSTAFFHSSLCDFTLFLGRFSLFYFYFFFYPLFILHIADKNLGKIDRFYPRTCPMCINQSRSPSYTASLCFRFIVRNEYENTQK